jgi:hypothetical protein
MRDPIKQIVDDFALIEKERSQPLPSGETTISSQTRGLIPTAFKVDSILGIPKATKVRLDRAF